MSIGVIRVGEGGYKIPFLKLSQTRVPAKYNLDGISLSDLTSPLISSSGSPLIKLSDSVPAS